MNKLEKELFEAGKIMIRLEPHPENEKASIAYLSKARENEDDPPSEEVSLKFLREGMRRLSVSSYGTTPLKELDGESIKGKYVEISELARKLTKEDTGGFDFFKMIYNRLEQMEGHYVEEPRLVFLYFHERPADSDFYIHRVAMKLHLRPEQLENELRDIKNMPTKEPTFPEDSHRQTNAPE